MHHSLNEKHSELIKLIYLYIYTDFREPCDDQCDTCGLFHTSLKRNPTDLTMYRRLKFYHRKAVKRENILLIITKIRKCQVGLVIFVSLVWTINKSSHLVLWITPNYPVCMSQSRVSNGVSNLSGMKGKQAEKEIILKPPYWRHCVANIQKKPKLLSWIHNGCFHNKKKIILCLRITEGVFEKL